MPIAAVDSRHHPPSQVFLGFGRELAGIGLGHPESYATALNSQINTGRISNWLKNPISNLSITADTPQEVVAFVAAVIKQSPALPNEADLSATVLFARSPTARHYLEALHSPHIVVLQDTSLARELGVPPLQNVHMIVPRKPKSGLASQDKHSYIHLTRLKRDAMERELNKMDYEPGNARRIAGESHGEYQAFLRGIRGGDEEDSPWLSEPAAGHLLPLVLARGWPDLEHPDHVALSRLAGRTYQEIQETARTWLSPRGPLQLVGGGWGWTAWSVEWKRLARHFTRSDADRFETAATDVLGTPDPVVLLDPEQRQLASFMGKSHPHSALLRSGLASSVAMFGSNSDSIPAVNGQAIADRVVYRLLRSPNLAEMWLSLAPWLPELAEAAPDVFIEAAECVVAEQAVVNALFAEGDFFSSSRHVYLLWALERLAWNPKYLSRVTVLLGRFAEVDPGGKQGNRPIGSLQTIFMPWYPCTMATVDERISAFDQLVNRSPGIAWRCALSLLPSDHAMTMGTSKPEFRQWDVREWKSVPVDGYVKFVPAIADRLLSLAGQNAEKWKELAAAFPKLIHNMPDKGTATVNTLLAMDTGQWTPTQRREIGELIREMIERHEEFSDSHWALEAEQIEVLRPLAAKFAPERLRDQFRQLFSNDVPLRRFRELPWEEEQRQLLIERQAAIEQVRRAEGLDGVLAWMHDVPAPQWLGDALATMPLTPEEEQVVLEQSLFVDRASDGSNAEYQFGNQFAFRRGRELGDDWKLNTLKRVYAAAGTEWALQFALALESTPPLWAALDSLDSDQASRYWVHARIGDLGVEHLEIAVPRLLQSNRTYAAIAIVASLTHDRRLANEPDPANTQRVLALCLQVMVEPPKHLPGDEVRPVAMQGAEYAIVELLDFIEKHAPESDSTTSLLVKWEWQWLEAFEHSRRGLRTLHKELARSPEFFIDVLKLVFKDKNKAEEDDSEAKEEAGIDAEQRRAMLNSGFRLLESWHRVPGFEPAPPSDEKGAAAAGKKDDPTAPATYGTINEAFLKNWIARSCELAKECGRLDPCESYIGRVFASAPADPDGAQPCAPVRNQIEQMKSEQLERSMSIAIQNRRGAHWVGHTGDQERKLRDTYRVMAERVRAGSPRTAAVFDSVAESYDRHAKRHDEEGHRRQYEH